MSRSNNLTFWQRVGVEIVWFWCRALSITPRWFRYYVFAQFLYFVVYRLCRYRVKVVDKNLLNSFPELTDAERRKIRDDFYHYLTEVGVSTVSLAGNHPERSIIPPHDEGSRIKELKRLTEGQSWIALTAHYGLWEYFMFWAPYAEQSLVAVYHPLENKLFEVIFRRLRTQANVLPIASKDTVRFCLEHKDGVEGKNYVIGLIADQNPPRRPNSEWFTFLNQDSIFFDGGEKLALKFNLPVYFVYQRRLRRGVYEFDYELIHDGAEAVEPNEITRRYISKLEGVIRENPSLWLWSHRRWKHNPKKWKYMKQS